MLTSLRARCATVASERRIRKIIHNRRAGTLSLFWDDEEVQTVVGGVADADRYARDHDLGYGGMDDESNGYWGSCAVPRP
jgi:hypothetical protein